MVATKETWIINGPVLLIAFATTQLYFVVRKKLGNGNSFAETSPPDTSPQSSWLANITLMAFAMFMALTILFVASFNEYKNSIWIWISVVCLIGATLYFVLLPGRSDTGSNAEPQTDSALARFGGAVPLTTVALVAFAVFILVNVLFYSSFFTNYPKGVSDAVFGVYLYREDGVGVFGTNTLIDGVAVPVQPEGVVRFSIGELELLPGAFDVDIGIKFTDTGFG